MSLRRNIEFKACLMDLAAARRIAEGVATERVGVERQVDTYFCVARGKLKLREIEGRGAWLIGYERSREVDSRPSDYRLVEIPDPRGLRETLADALGVRGVVSKVREIFLHRNVRIHLDQVEGQGDFLEFEAVLRVMLAPFGTDADLARTLRQTREEIQSTILTVADRISDEYRDGRAPFQRYAQYRSIMHDFLLEFGQLIDDWAERAEERMARWPAMTEEERYREGVEIFDQHRPKRKPSLPAPSDSR